MERKRLLQWCEEETMVAWATAVEWGELQAYKWLQFTGSV